MLPAIRAAGLGKRYWISEGRAPYTTFRDTLAAIVRSPYIRRRRTPGDAMWALQEVSFDIAPGRVTGIIGQNGAGKSTLLKILSRITPPTTGRAEIRGRIASLLEIGTGFHPELTGRRNVFLNGAILGMTRKEIQDNFDAIVAFADVERFLDTPVKFYSTGMYLRLAFAVAAHLNAEILAVDEVLAVGDLVFQRKCLGRMSDVAHDGRTVLLVSHNMAAIQSLSDEVLLFERGRLVHQGAPDAVVGAYVERLEDSHSVRTSSDLAAAHRAVPSEAGFSEGFLNRRPLIARHTVRSGDDLAFELVVSAAEARRHCYVAINIEDEFGVRVWSLHSRWHVLRFDMKAGDYRVTCRTKRPPLVPGHYYISLELVAGQERLDALDRIAALHILETDTFATGEIPRREHGYVHAPAEWTVADVTAGVSLAAPNGSP
jgi:lipopolysaccharide transport system ATP-binding protein